MPNVVLMCLGSTKRDTTRKRAGGRDVLTSVEALVGDIIQSDSAQSQETPKGVLVPSKSPGTDGSDGLEASVQSQTLPSATYRATTGWS